MTTSTPTNKPFTPYRAAELVNETLRAEGIKEIPTQMMYNYTTQKVNQGKRPLIKFEYDESGTPIVDKDDLMRWLTSYVNKKRPQREEQKFEDVIIVGDRSA
jgi:hypothetical protein